MDPEPFPPQVSSAAHWPADVHLGKELPPGDGFLKLSADFSGSAVFQLKPVCAGINWLVTVYSGISQLVQTELFRAKSVQVRCCTDWHWHTGHSQQTSFYAGTIRIGSWNRSLKTRPWPCRTFQTWCRKWGTLERWRSARRWACPPKMKANIKIPQDTHVAENDITNIMISWMF